MSARLSGGADLTGIGLCIIAVLGLSIATLSLRSFSSTRNVMMVVGFANVGRQHRAVPCIFDV